MAETYVSLKHEDVNGGDAIQIMCTGVTVALNKKNDKSPNTLYTQYPVDVQTIGRENAKYTLDNVKLGVADLDYSTLLEIFNLENDEGMILNVKYNNIWLTDSLSETTDIPVTIDGGVNIKFSTKESRDSYMSTLNIPLIEVKKS